MARERDALLSEKNYDNDATMVPSDSEPASDDEVERTSNVREEDRDILEETEEHEELLHKPSRLDKVKGAFGLRDNGHGDNDGRPKSRNRRFARRGVDTPEMERGGGDSGSIASTESFEIQDAKWDAKDSRKSHRGRLTLIFLSIVGLFLILLLGAYKASSKKHKLAPTEHRLIRHTNGTHTFRPTTILISLDGFRADFLNRDLTPALSAFVASGVSPKYMLPSFPSVTFPNHFTLMTGLYPESHGVVGNQFWDPELQEEFWYTNVGVSMQPKWWNAEPLWVTAEHQGVRSAIHMWPGSEAHIPDVEPTYMDRYNGSEALPLKVDRILRWLDMPGDDDAAAAGATELRPQLIAAYVPNVDADGHLYGPNSTEIRATIADVDSMLTILVEGVSPPPTLPRVEERPVVRIIVLNTNGAAASGQKFDRNCQLGHRF
jgi:hypothetical protein